MTVDDEDDGNEEEEDDGAIEARWLPRLKKIDPNIVEEEEGVFWFLALP